MSIETARSELLTNPKAFLESNALVIYGSNVGGSGAKRFVLQATEAAGWKSVARGEAREVPLFVMFEEGGFNGKGSGPVSTGIDTHYVSMRQVQPESGKWEDTGTTHYTLPPDGASVMVTSKINGCTFGIGSNAGGARLVSHLKPPGEDPSGRLTLDKGTREGFKGGKLDVSVMSSGTQNGTVIGLRSGQQWTFYAQRFQMFPSMSGIINEVQVYK
jgi:hypothetical protein